MSNIDTLCNDLSFVIQKLKSGEMEPKQAEAITNASGKILKGRIAQMNHEEAVLSVSGFKAIPFFTPSES